MRVVLAFCLVACGDNAPECGYVEVLSSIRNIWSPQIAVDDTQVYYSDYNHDGLGTHLVLRQDKGGDRELALALRTRDHSFGWGLAVDPTYLFWTAETDPTGYALFATPKLGGRTLELATLSECEAHGIAVDGTNAYAGAIRCNDLPSRVYAVNYSTTTVAIVFESLTADVEDVAIAGGELFVATTGGLVKITTTGPVLIDGHPTHRLQVIADELAYSTDEGVFAVGFAGVQPRQLYTFETAIDQPRAFAVDEHGVFVLEPPQILYVPNRGGAPIVVVNQAGSGVEYLVARDGVAYWSALALRNTPGTPGSLSGGVLSVKRPCL